MARKTKKKTPSRSSRPTTKKRTLQRAGAKGSSSSSRKTSSRLRSPSRQGKSLKELQSDLMKLRREIARVFELKAS